VSLAASTQAPASGLSGPALSGKEAAQLAKEAAMLKLLKGVR
jgi:hypothetical protein